MDAVGADTGLRHEHLSRARNILFLNGAEERRYRVVSAVLGL